MYTIPSVAIAGVMQARKKQVLYGKCETVWNEYMQDLLNTIAQVFFMLLRARWATNTDFTLLCITCSKTNLPFCVVYQRIPFYQRPQLMHAARYAVEIFHFAFELHVAFIAVGIMDKRNYFVIWQCSDVWLHYGMNSSMACVQFIAAIKMYRELLIFMSRGIRALTNARHKSKQLSKRSGNSHNIIDYRIWQLYKLTESSWMLRKLTRFVYFEANIRRYIYCTVESSQPQLFLYISEAAKYTQLKHCKYLNKLSTRQIFSLLHSTYLH